MTSNAMPPQPPTAHWFTPHPLNLEIQQRFLALDQGEKVQAEYVWIGGRNELRCKTKVSARGCARLSAVCTPFYCRALADPMRRHSTRHRRALKIWCACLLTQASLLPT